MAAGEPSGTAVVVLGAAAAGQQEDAARVAVVVRGHVAVGNRLCARAQVRCQGLAAEWAAQHAVRVRVRNDSCLSTGKCTEYAFLLPYMDGMAAKAWSIGVERRRRVAGRAVVGRIPAFIRGLPCVNMACVNCCGQF